MSNNKLSRIAHQGDPYGQYASDQTTHDPYGTLARGDGNLAMHHSTTLFDAKPTTFDPALGHVPAKAEGAHADLTANGLTIGEGLIHLGIDLDQEVAGDPATAWLMANDPTFRQQNQGDRH
jgi:hypothetical protein